MSASALDGKVPVVIVGAGVAGLAGAIALADAGWEVLVVERMEDPETPQASVDLEQVTALVAEANRQRRAGETVADRTFLAARKILDRFWGNQGRNILLDSHSLRFLEGHGVDTSELPRLGSIGMSGSAAGPTFEAEVGGHAWQQSSSRPSAWRLLLCRDWIAQPSLGDFERVLRRAAEERSEVTLLFGTEVCDCTPGADSVKVDLKDLADGTETSLTSEMLILADGGGRRSLARRLGVKAHCFSRERIDFAVFESSTEVAVYGHAMDEVFSHNCFTESGWVGMFCSGRTLSCVVNSEPYEGKRTPTPAWQQLNQLGVTTDLVEPPRSVAVEVARCERFTVGPRVWIAGDAAVRGNPRFGLGVQFGLLWADALADSLGAPSDFVSEASLDLAVACFEDRAEEIAGTRTSFETLWIELLDQAVQEQWALGDPAVQDYLNRSVEEFSMETKDGRVRCRIKLEFEPLVDAVRRSGPRGAVLIAALAQLGKMSLTLDATMEVRDDSTVLLHLCDAQGRDSAALMMQFGDAEMRARSGSLECTFDADGFRLVVRDARVEQRSGQLTESEGDQSGGVQSSFWANRMQTRLPASLLRQLTLGASRESPAVGGGSQPDVSPTPWVVNAHFAERVEVDWGPLRTRMHSAHLRATVGATRGGRYRTSIEILAGRMEPLSTASFARTLVSNSSRWLTAASKLSAGLSDLWFDAFVRSSSRWIQRMDFEFLDDEGALLTLSGARSISLYLPREDAESLRAGLLSPSSTASLWRGYASGLEYYSVSR